jgi:hypothetical protein
MTKEVNSSMICLIFCKNFCKCHNVPPVQQLKKKKKKERREKSITKKKKVGGVVQVVECLCNKCEVPNSNLSAAKKDNKTKQKTVWFKTFWHALFFLTHSDIVLQFLCLCAFYSMKILTLSLFPFIF